MFRDHILTGPNFIRLRIHKTGRLWIVCDLHEIRSDQYAMEKLDIWETETQSIQDTFGIKSTMLGFFFLVFFFY